jgi:hypothetical protein
MQLDLESAERDLLVHILEYELREKRVEVRRTSTPDYHDRLKDEEQAIGGLLERLRALA